jgi:hypothetical protein
VAAVDFDFGRQAELVILAPALDAALRDALALQLHFSLEVGTARLGLVSASPE